MKSSIKINTFFSTRTTVIKETRSPWGKIKGKTFSTYAHKNSAGNSSFPALFLYRLIQMIISLWVMGVLMNFLDGREAVSRLSALWLFMAEGNFRCYSDADCVQSIAEPLAKSALCAYSPAAEKE